MVLEAGGRDESEELVATPSADTPSMDGQSAGRKDAAAGIDFTSWSDYGGTYTGTMVSSSRYAATQSHDSYCDERSYYRSYSSLEGDESRDSESDTMVSRLDTLTQTAESRDIPFEHSVDYEMICFSSPPQSHDVDMANNSIVSFNHDHGPPAPSVKPEDSSFIPYECASPIGDAANVLAEDYACDGNGFLSDGKASCSPVLYHSPRTGPVEHCPVAASEAIDSSRTPSADLELSDQVANVEEKNALVPRVEVPDPYVPSPTILYFSPRKRREIVPSLSDAEQSSSPSIHDISTSSEHNIATSGNKIRKTFRRFLRPSRKSKRSVPVASPAISVSSEEEEDEVVACSVTTESPKVQSLKSGAEDRELDISSKSIALPTKTETKEDGTTEITLDNNETSRKAERRGPPSNENNVLLHGLPESKSNVVQSTGASTISKDNTTKDWAQESIGSLILSNSSMESGDGESTCPVRPRTNKSSSDAADPIEAFEVNPDGSIQRFERGKDRPVETIHSFDQSESPHPISNAATVSSAYETKEQATASYQTTSTQSSNAKTNAAVELAEDEPTDNVRDNVRPARGLFLRGKLSKTKEATDICQDLVSNASSAPDVIIDASVVDPGARRVLEDWDASSSERSATAPDIDIGTSALPNAISSCQVFEEKSSSSDEEDENREKHKASEVSTFLNSLVADSPVTHDLSDEDRNTEGPVDSTQSTYHPLESMRIPTTLSLGTTVSDYVLQPIDPTGCTVGQIKSSTPVASSLKGGSGSAQVGLVEPLPSSAAQSNAEADAILDEEEASRGHGSEDKLDSSDPIDSVGQGHHDDTDGGRNEGIEAISSSGNTSLDLDASCLVQGAQPLRPPSFDDSKHTRRKNALKDKTRPRNLLKRLGKMTRHPRADPSGQVDGAATALDTSSSAATDRLTATTDVTNSPLLDHTGARVEDTSHIDSTKSNDDEESSSLHSPRSQSSREQPSTTSRQNLAKNAVVDTVDESEDSQDTHDYSLANRNRVEHRSPTPPNESVSQTIGGGSKTVEIARVVITVGGAALIDAEESSSSNEEDATKAKTKQSLPHLSRKVMRLRTCTRKSPQRRRKQCQSQSNTSSQHSVERTTERSDPNTKKPPADPVMETFMPTADVNACESPDESRPEDEFLLSEEIECRLGTDDSKGKRDGCIETHCFLNSNLEKTTSVRMKPKTRMSLTSNLPRLSMPFSLSKRHVSNQEDKARLSRMRKEPHGEVDKGKKVEVSGLDSEQNETSKHPEACVIAASLDEARRMKPTGSGIKSPNGVDKGNKSNDTGPIAPHENLDPTKRSEASGTACPTIEPRPTGVPHQHDMNKGTQSDVLQPLERERATKYPGRRKGSEVVSEARQERSRPRMAEPRNLEHEEKQNDFSESTGVHRPLPPNRASAQGHAEAAESSTTPGEVDQSRSPGTGREAKNDANERDNDATGLILVHKLNHSEQKRKGIRSMSIKAILSTATGGERQCNNGVSTATWKSFGDKRSSEHNGTQSTARGGKQSHGKNFTPPNVQTSVKTWKEKRSPEMDVSSSRELLAISKPTGSRKKSIPKQSSSARVERRPSKMNAGQLNDLSASALAPSIAQDSPELPPTGRSAAARALKTSSKTDAMIRVTSPATPKSPAAQKSLLKAISKPPSAKGAGKAFSKNDLFRRGSSAPAATSPAATKSPEQTISMKPTTARAVETSPNKDLVRSSPPAKGPPEGDTTPEQTKPSPAAGTPKTSSTKDRLSPPTTATRVAKKSRAKRNSKQNTTAKPVRAPSKKDLPRRCASTSSPSAVKQSSEQETWKSSVTTGAVNNSSKADLLVSRAPATVSSSAKKSTEDAVMKTPRSTKSAVPRSRKGEVKAAAKQSKETMNEKGRSGKARRKSQTGIKGMVGGRPPNGTQRKSEKVLIVDEENEFQASVMTLKVNLGTAQPKNTSEKKFHKQKRASKRQVKQSDTVVKGKSANDVNKEAEETNKTKAPKAMEKKAKSTKQRSQAGGRAKEKDYSSSKQTEKTTELKPRSIGTNLPDGSKPSEQRVLSTLEVDRTSKQHADTNDTDKRNKRAERASSKQSSVQQANQRKRRSSSKQKQGGKDSRKVPQSKSTKRISRGGRRRKKSKGREKSSKAGTQKREKELAIATLPFEDSAEDFWS